MSIKHALLRLHALTDREWSLDRDTLTVMRAALAGGATVIQLRDKNVSTRTLVEEGQALRALTQEYNALFIVNDRLDVALATDADGLHVGQDDLAADIARRLLGPDKILGVSAGNMEEATQAIAAGADYLGIGPIYQTVAKLDAGPATGLQLLREITNRYPQTPLVAIGGITPENTREIIRAGAVGIAVIRAIVHAEDVEQATRSLAQAIPD